MLVARSFGAILGLSVGVVGSVEAQRAVEANVLVSTTRPAIRLAIDTAFTYLGTQSVVLFGRAAAEQHFFAVARGPRITRLLWVQFEGKLPNDGSSYDYSRYPVMDIAGRPFHHDGRFFEVRIDEERPGSDFRHALEFLRARGFRLGPDVMRQRLVWLLDRPPRNELMIIYYEDLHDHSLTVADLDREGGAADRWDEIARALLDRAVRAMTFSDLPTH